MSTLSHDENDLGEEVDEEVEEVAPEAAEPTDDDQIIFNGKRVSVDVGLKALRRVDRERDWELEVHQRDQVGCIVRDLVRYLRQEVFAEQSRKVLEGPQEDEVRNGPSRTGTGARCVPIATSTHTVRCRCKR